MEKSEIYLNNKLPNNLEAEQSVLGSILVDSSCISKVIETLKPEYFYTKQNKEIFVIMIKMFMLSNPIDVVTVLGEVVKEKIFEKEEDSKVYLVKLIEMVPSAANALSYAKIVYETYLARELILTANDIVEKCNSSESDSSDLIEYAEQKIFDIRKGQESGEVVKLSKVLLDNYDKLQKIGSGNGEDYLGIPTGYSDIDRITTGLNKTDLVLIAARPAMGKTSFALNIATNVAINQNKKVVVFSLEMGKEQLANRILSSQAMIKGSLLRTGKLTSDDWIRISEATQILYKSNIYIDETPGITVGQMKAKLRRIKDVDLVVIDYLQLMSSGKRIESRVQEVSEITRGLKIMAKELKVPVITLSQLSRSTETRSDHRPMLSDLRESGSIEQDADIVMFLYRENYYRPDNGEENIAECIVAKNRHGETGSVRMGWDGEYTRFYSIDYTHEY